MKAIKLILICCCLSFLTQAQQYFNSTYASPVHVLASAIVETETGYMVVGQMPTTADRQMLFYKLNFNGDTTWRKTYAEEPKIFYPTSILLEGTDFLVAGSYRDSAGTENSNIFLSLFDKDANLLWMKSYGGPLFDNFGSMKRTQDGGLIMVGSYKNLTDSLSDFYLIKMDSLGEVEWEKTYGEQGIMEHAFGLTLSSDGGYALSGQGWVLPSDTNFGNYDHLVVKVDRFGELQWRKTYGTKETDSGGGIHQLEDKSYIISTGFGSTTQQHVPIVLKIDSVGNMLWQKQFLGDGYSTFSLPMVINNAQELTVCGFVYKNQFGPIVFITKIDTAGNEIWRREYLTDSLKSQYIYDLKATSDGGYIFCGSAFDSTNTQRAWVVKLDCFGCDSLLCYFPDSLCVPEVSLPEWHKILPELKLYPNPNTGSFTLDLTAFPPENRALRIFDSKGRKVYEHIVSGKEIIDTNLERGMYFLEVQGLGIREKVIIK